MNLPVKVCGITRLEDGQAAVDCGAAAVGFIFHPSSPRYVAPERAAEIAHALPPAVARVGVFVNAGAAEMHRVAGLCGLTHLQLHGDEPAAAVAALALPAYRAFRLREAADAVRVEQAPDAIVLLDTFDAGDFGGTGRAFDWTWVAGMGARRRVILAGGLSPENVRGAVETARPAGVDVSSGVEQAPGVKDAALIAAFMDAVRDAPFSTPSPWSCAHG